MPCPPMSREVEGEASDPSALSCPAGSRYSDGLTANRGQGEPWLGLVASRLAAGHGPCHCRCTFGGGEGSWGAEGLARVIYAEPGSTSRI